MSSRRITVFLNGSPVDLIYTISAGTSDELMWWFSDTDLGRQTLSDREISGIEMVIEDDFEVRRAQWSIQRDSYIARKRRSTL